MGKLVKMAEFVLKNNYFQFSDKVYQKISGTAIGTKFAPPYACIFMNQVESSCKLKSFNLLYGLGTLTKFPSFGLMVKSILKIPWWNLIALILISSLFMSSVKQVSIS